MDFAPGSVFAGDYRIERPLSQGGMGAVFVVTQLSTGKRRALKLMHSQLVVDPESLRRFEQEARVGSRIASEHVVEVVAAGVDRATAVPYLVMELLEGEDLLTRMKRGPLPPDELFTVLEQLAHALGAAHDAGVVHRDLKPENVFLGVSRRTGASMVVKVLDFGIAKVTEDQRRTTAAFGTPMWLAPEQTRRGEITPAADVWAFGLLVFALATGHFFWRSGESPTGSVATLMSEILHDPIPPASLRASEVGARVPEGLDGWLARALDRDPRARFPNARAAFEALVPVLRPTAPPPKSRRGLAIALVAIGVLSLAAVGAFLAVAMRARGPQTIAASAPPIVSDVPVAASTPPSSEAVTPVVVAPSASASAGAVGIAHIGVFAASGDTTLQAEVANKVDGRFGDELAACLADTPTRSRNGSALVQLFVAADGSVMSASELYGQRTKPSVQCMIGKLKKERFASRNKAASAMFSLLWTPP